MSREDFNIGEYIIYVNGEKYELGRIKSLQDDGAFVAYHEGETGAKTESSLGGEYFKIEGADCPWR